MYLIKLIKYNKIYKNATILLLFFISYFLFFLSLEKCKQGEDICCTKFSWIKRKVIEESISCFITIILLELIILKKISKSHFFHFIIMYALFYSFSNGVTFDDHGYYNIIYFFVIIIFFLLFIFFSKYIFSVKNKKILFLFTLLFLMLVIGLRNSIYNKFGCDDWKNGLNNTSIDNNKSKYKCLIQFPKFCHYKIGKYFLDVNRFYTDKCLIRNFNPRNIFLKQSQSPFINDKTFHIGFPLTNKEPKFLNNIFIDDFHKYVYSNLIDMNNLTLLNLLKDKKPEISIDFSNNNIGKMNINLNYNKTLSYERKQLERIANPYSKNIMIIYLDSVSRAYSIRQLKKTLKFFEKFISYNGYSNSKFPFENFHSFQFFKYHSHKFFTVGNFPLMFYGNHRNKSNKHINLYFKRNGYVTGYTADTCYNDFTNALHNFSSSDVFDHHYVVCDPNFEAQISKLYCNYNKIYIEFLLEYSNQFWRKYNNNQKFLLILSNFAHESSYEKLKYIDNIIYQFINRLFNDNLLKKTSLFLLSDHGISIPSIYYLTEFYKYEQVLPMFYLLVNDRKNISYDSQYKYLNENQQAFITGFDIYNTLINLIYGDKYGTEETKNIISKRGQSLFSKINSLNRSPKDYDSMDLFACI